MRALPHDHAVLHHEDEIGVRNGGNALGDDKGHALADSAAQRFLELGFGLGIDRTGRIVQNQNIGILRKGARDGKSLLLSAGEVLAALLHNRVNAVG